MRLLTHWLAEACESFAAPFYTERLSLLNTLKEPNFIASQKEHYHNLGGLLELWTRQPYDGHWSIDAAPEVTACCHLPGALTITFVNGILSNCLDGHQGIQLHRLSGFPLPKQQEVLAAYRDDTGSSDDLFVLLNRLLARDSYLLEITSEQHTVITLQHILSPGPCHLVPQLMVRLGKRAKATIVETWYTLAHEAPPFVNNFTHILLEEAAKLSYYTLYTDHPSAYQVNTLYTHQKDHSTLTHHTFALASTMLSMHLRAQIDGSHACANLYGLSSLGAKEQAAHRIQVIHSAPGSLSRQHYKSILAGHSTGYFSGKIYLTPSAQQTNAYQTNNALILSDQAHHYARPQLEIYADDVKCSHGATTGALDKEALFYLQARGIPAYLAQRLLLEAFGSQIIESVSLPILQDYLYDKLVAKLIKL